MKRQTTKTIEETLLEVATRALNDIANGKANNGIAYFAEQLRGIAYDALTEMHFLQYEQRRKAKTDRETCSTD